MKISKVSLIGILIFVVVFFASPLVTCNVTKVEAETPTLNTTEFAPFYSVVDDKLTAGVRALHSSNYESFAYSMNWTLKLSGPDDKEFLLFGVEGVSLNAYHTHSQKMKSIPDLGTYTNLILSYEVLDSMGKLLFKSSNEIPFALPIPNGGMVYKSEFHNYPINGAKSKVIGDITAIECMRSADKSKLFISLHHYKTKGGTFIEQKADYIVVDGEKYHCRETDIFITKSQSPCSSRVKEFVFDIERDEFPQKLKTAKTVKFYYAAFHNGKLHVVDETLKIADIVE